MSKSNADVSARVPITEVFSLPSNGRIPGVPTQVTMRCMTTFEEKMRLSGGSSIQIIRHILNSCIVEPEDVDVNEFPDFDVWYLLYKLRIMTYGQDYKFSVRCSTCGSVINTSTDLDQLDVIYLDENISEPYEIEYPYSKDIVGLRFLRSKDIEEINSESTRIKLKSPEYVGDPAYLLNLEHSIATVNGKELSKMDLKKYVMNIVGRDSAYHQAKYDKMKNVGIITKVQVECPNCGEIETYSLPFTSEFFRPTYDD